MRKKTVGLGFWFGLAALSPVLGVACAGTPLSMGDMNGGSAGKGGAVTAGSDSSGGGTTSSGGSSGGMAGSPQQTCDKAACGPQLGLLNEMCADGSIGGPTGRCLKNTDGSCGWEIRQCPDMGAGGEANGGSSGVGGAPSCGGTVCNADQICCGPAECGHCISKLSGQACPLTCPNGGGSGGSGGTPDCAALLDDLNQKQAAAQACNPSSAKPTPECQGSLEGRCCPIGVESASTTTPANAAYLAALKAYKASCEYACPKIACFDPQVGDCRAASAAAGTCYP